MDVAVAVSHPAPPPSPPRHTQVPSPLRHPPSPLTQRGPTPNPLPRGPPMSPGPPPPPLPPPPPGCPSSHSQLPMSPVMSIISTQSSILPLKMEKPVYSSPPPAPSNAENNTCRMIDYRGAKVAAFTVDGRELICLPQAFDLFLKHLVGGLHTVYTKLKRLDVIPIVCNVEQVRILRGLGAIQPGVNRCKLIAPKEFDILYEDCTNSSARPGRPPKRSPVISAMPETLEKLKKSRMDNGEYPYSPGRLLDPKKSPLFGNGYHYPPHMGSMPLPFMPLGHPMMTMAMANHMALRPDGSVIRDRHPVEDINARHREDPRYDDGMSHAEKNNNTHKPMDIPLNLHADGLPERRPSVDKESVLSSAASDGMTNGQLDLSMKNTGTSCTDDMDDDSDDDKDDDDDLSDIGTPRHTPTDVTSVSEKAPPAPAPPLPFNTQLLNTENTGISSVETLLMNIQGLLKVASENARHRERQSNYEKAELKMDLMRERELRESLEKQLIDEQRNKFALQKRLKKEKKVRRRLQDQVEQLNTGSKPLTPPAEDTHKQTSPDNLRMLHADSSNTEMERDRSPVGSAESERRVPDPHSGIQNLMDTFLGPQKHPLVVNGGTNGYLPHPPPIIKSTVQESV